MLVLFILEFVPATAQAGPSWKSFSVRREMTVGIIQKVNRNMITIEDERDHQIRNLIRPGIEHEFKVGDYVRVYYRTNGNIIDTIKKMTPVEYKKEGQNRGYISKGKD